MKKTVMLVAAVVAMMLLLTGCGEKNCYFVTKDRQDLQVGAKVVWYDAYVGKVERDGTVRDRSNSYIGKIESDGTVRDRSNSYLGKIENDGTVRDKSNRSIGKADGIERRYAALFFFFGMP